MQRDSTSRDRDVIRRCKFRLTYGLVFFFRREENSMISFVSLASGVALCDFFSYSETKRTINSPYIFKTVVKKTRFTRYGAKIRTPLFPHER